MTFQELINRARAVADGYGLDQCQVGVDFEHWSRPRQLAGGTRTLEEFSVQIFVSQKKPLYDSISVEADSPKLALALLDAEIRKQLGIPQHPDSIVALGDVPESAGTQ